MGESVETEPRVVLARVISYKDATGRMRNARRGDTILATPHVIERLNRGRVPALAEAGEGIPEATQRSSLKQDVYRAGRGDAGAAARVAARAAERQPPPTGGIVNVDEETPAQHAEAIRMGKLNVSQTVALAEGDPDRARAVLEGEKLATHGEPREGVVKGLTKIIEGG